MRVARKIVRIDSAVVFTSIWFSMSSLLNSVRSSFAVSSENSRLKIENVTRPIVWATWVSKAWLAQVMTPSVPTAITRPLNTSQRAVAG